MSTGNDPGSNRAPNGGPRLSFEEREGAVPAPKQLALKEMSKGLRVSLFHDILLELEGSSVSGIEGRYLRDPWQKILRDMYVRRDHGFSHGFSTGLSEIRTEILRITTSMPYTEVFGWIEWVLRHELCPKSFGDAVQRTLIRERSAYRIVDHDTISALGSEEELAAFERAVADLKRGRLDGAAAHLKNAASELSRGKFADSVRESIHAVESAARTIEPSGELNKALSKLEKREKIHGAMRAGFSSLYGYTSDAGGIRHALLNDEGDAKVDESDALFMIGACAAFVSYLVNKARDTT